LFGNNEKLALEAARELDATAEKLQDRDKRRGILGMVRCIYDVARHNLAKLEPLASDPAAFDRVILATPVWADHITPAARAFLIQQKERIKDLVLLSSSYFGPKNERFLADIEALLGRRPSASFLTTQKEIKDNSYQAKLNDFLRSLR